MNTSKALTACCLTFLTFLPVGAIAADREFAQLLRPQGSIPDGGVYQQAQGLDAAGMSVRVDRLENQVRNLTGQLEQMQFQNKRLEDQLRKFQEDVEFRFRDNGGKAAPAPRPPASGPGKRSDLNDSGYPVTGDAGGFDSPQLPPSGAGPRVAGRRGDAFDPSLDPNAPGAPRDLGSLPAGSNAAPPPSANPRYAGPLPTGPLAAEGEVDDVDPDAPLDLMRRSTVSPRGPGNGGLVTAGISGAPNDDYGVLPPPQQAPVPRVIAAPPVVPAGPQVATLPSVQPVVDDFELGSAALREGQLEAAEQRFRSYLDKHPKDRFAADATFYLGESYFRRSRPREAAEQYLKVSTDFPKASRAPESLVKLGLSLEKLGAREQACAAFGEVGRKYPTAAPIVKASADREIKRAQC